MVPKRQARMQTNNGWKPAVVREVDMLKTNRLLTLQINFPLPRGKSSLCKLTFPYSGVKFHFVN